MKKALIYILISIITFSFSCESVKLFSKIAEKNLLIDVNNYCDNDNTTEADDKADNENDTFLEYDFFYSNSQNLYLQKAHLHNMVHKDKFQTSDHFESIDFPPELV